MKEALFWEYGPKCTLTINLCFLLWYKMCHYTSTRSAKTKVSVSRKNLEDTSMKCNPWLFARYQYLPSSMIYYWINSPGRIWWILKQYTCALLTNWQWTQIFQPTFLYTSWFFISDHPLPSLISVHVIGHRLNVCCRLLFEMSNGTSASCVISSGDRWCGTILSCLYVSTISGGCTMCID